MPSRCGGGASTASSGFTTAPPCARHPQSIARSFGFGVPPRVNLNIESKAAHARKAARTKAVAAGGGKGGGDYRRGTGHTFSASNPYGKRAAGDSRQFVRG